MKKGELRWKKLTEIVGVLGVVVALGLGVLNTYWNFFRHFDELSLGISHVNVGAVADDTVFALAFSIANTGTGPMIVSDMRMLATPKGLPTGQVRISWRDSTLKATAEPVLLEAGGLASERVYFPFNLSELEQPTSGIVPLILHIEIVDSQGNLNTREISDFHIAVHSGTYSGHGRPPQRQFTLIPKPTTDTSIPFPL